MSSIFAVGLAVSLRPVSYWLAWSTILVVVFNIYASLLGVSLTEPKAHGLVAANFDSTTINSPISWQQLILRRRPKAQKVRRALTAISLSLVCHFLPVPAGSLRARMRAPRPAGMQNRLLACGGDRQFVIDRQIQSVG